MLTKPLSTGVHSGRTPFLLFVSLLLSALVMAGLTTSANAAVQDNFELEGNVLNVAGGSPDWSSLFNGAGAEINPAPAGFFDSGFTRDFIPGSTGDTSAFTGGGSKDDLDVSGWKCKSESNTTDKGDLQNVYATVANVNNQLIIYFGAEKNAPNGTNNIAIWFMQDGTVACDGTGVGGSGKVFAGEHKDGDIFLAAAFTNGGSNPTIQARHWIGNGASGSLSGIDNAGTKCGDAGSANLCAITNDTDSVTTPWQTTNKGSATPQNKTGQGTTLNADQFYEGAINLTALGLDVDSDDNPICINRFVFNTRSSSGPDAILYDFAAGDFQTCASPKIDTLLKLEAGAPGSEGDVSLPADGDHTVTLPATVYDTSVISEGFQPALGTVTYSLYTNNTCTAASTDPLFGNGTNSAEVTVNANGSVPASPSLVFDEPGDYWWAAHYEPGDGSRNDSADSVCASEPLTIEKVSPTIATAPSPTTLVIGGDPAADFTDTATISGGYFPVGGPDEGDVEFNLYGPFDAPPGSESCTAAKLVNTQTIGAARATNTTATATTAAYAPQAVGLYQWTAEYKGNTQNNATAVSACGDTTEQVTVQPATPTIATKILLSDTAKVTGVANAGPISGSVRFTLHPTADCTGDAAYDSLAVDLVNGEATTPAATAVIAGTWSWKVVFSPTEGSNYTGATTTCSPDASEKAVISYLSPSPIS